MGYFKLPIKIQPFFDRQLAGLIQELNAAVAA